MKCSSCGYEWNTSSQLKKVTCPSCGYKTLNSKEFGDLLKGKVKIF